MIAARTIVAEIIPHVKMLIVVHGITLVSIIIYLIGIFIRNWIVRTSVITRASISARTSAIDVPTVSAISRISSKF